MHQVSVIISNFNGAKYLPRLIETLQAQQGVELEIIVVDRNSADESDAILAQHADIKVIKHPPETGLVCGYAAAVGASTCDMLFFMNEDMWLAPDCLAECVAVMNSLPRIGAVMPIQWTYDGAGIVNAGIWYETCGWSRADPVLTRRSRWHVVNRPARLSFANAGACLLRKDAYDDAGGWDTSFFLDGEDMDLGIRLWQRGWECWIAPSATVGHAVGASNQKILPKTGSAVGRKRYVHAFSNFLVLALKYFSVPAIPRAFAALSDTMLRDVLTGRWKNVLLDFQALMLTCRRFPEWAAFRKRNAALNHARPGEQFFFEPVFQHDAIRENKSPRSHVEPFLP